MSQSVIMCHKLSPKPISRRQFALLQFIRNMDVDRLQTIS